MDVIMLKLNSQKGEDILMSFEDRMKIWDSAVDHVNDINNQLQTIIMEAEYFFVAPAHDMDNLFDEFKKYRDKRFDKRI